MIRFAAVISCSANDVKAQSFGVNLYCGNLINSEPPWEVLRIGLTWVTVKF